MKHINPNTVFLIEFVGGLFGLLGFGHFYVGNSKTGWYRLIGWIIWIIAAYAVINLLPRIMAMCICLPMQLFIQVTVPFWLANRLKKQIIGSHAANHPS